MTTFWNSFPSNRLLAEVSLWSARLHSLKEDMARVEPYVDLYHIDVTDAHFAPGLIFFPDLVAALRPLSPKPFHVHLMVENPLSLIDDFASAGANIITIHAENGDQIEPALNRIHEHGLLAGLALQLSTPPEAVLPHLDHLSIVTMMSTLLGIKGVGLDDSALPRIRAMRALLHERGCEDRVKIANDGGNRAHTVPLIRAAGADTIVPGSLVFGSSNLAETFAWLHSL